MSNQDEVTALPKPKKGESGKAYARRLIAEMEARVKRKYDSNLVETVNMFLRKGSYLHARVLANLIDR